MEKYSAVIKYSSGSTYNVKFVLTNTYNDIGFYTESNVIANEFTTSSVELSGVCESRLSELIKYNGDYLIYTGGTRGVVTSSDITGTTKYYVDGILYYDYTGSNVTYFYTTSTGILSGDTNDYFVYKNDDYFGLTTPPKILSSIFVERPATSVFENIYRLFENSRISDIEKYGGSTTFNIIKNS